MNIDQLQHARTQQIEYCRKNRKSADAWLKLAEICFALGQIEESIKYCKTAIKLKPSYGAAYHLLGDIYWHSGNIPSSVVAFKKSVKHNRTDFEALKMLGMLSQQSGDFSNALDYYKQSLELNPGQPSVLYNTGVIYQNMGRDEDAVHQYQRAIEVKPDYAYAYANMGYIYRAAGKLDESISAYRKALAIMPDETRIHYNLGVSYTAGHEYALAESCYKRSIEIDPGFADAHIALCSAYLSTGALESAIAACDASLNTLPDNTDLLLVKANALSLSGDDRRAFQCISKAYDKDPLNANAILAMGEIHLKNDKIDDAMVYARTGLEHFPDNPSIQHLTGRICKQKGFIDKAIEHYSRALSLEPDNDYISADMAEILESRAEFDAAMNIVETIVISNPDNTKALAVYSSLASRYGKREHAISLMENRLKSTSEIDAIDLHKELGKHYDATGKYDKAYEHYQRFNTISRKLNAEWVSRNVIDEDIRTISQWESRHGRDFWQNIGKSRCMSARPVFIVGMPRSGTSLLEHILTSHPEIYGAGELRTIPELLEQYTEQHGNTTAFPEILRKMTTEESTELAEKYLMLLNTLESHSARVIDKMPTNFWYLGFIATLFPNAGIIDISRNPLDTCLSIYFQKFGASMPFTTDLMEIGSYYINYQRLMNYWKTVLDIKIYDISYDELVTDPEHHIRGVLDYCGLDWSDKCLRFYEQKRDVNTPSYDQVRQPIYSKSSGRWKNYKPHLQELARLLKLEL